MILALTPNPALDITYDLAETLAVHGEHRVRTVRRRPGGKGVNTARVLVALGAHVSVAGPLGGATGNELDQLLAAAERTIGRYWTPIAGTTRSTVTLVDPGGATGLNEPGPQLTDDERDHVIADLGELADSGILDAVSIAGSLPGGLGPEDLAAIVRRFRSASIPVLVDTSGPGLLAAARAGADLLKPNRGEALAATGTNDPEEAARALIDLGAQAVLCSLGTEGMLLVRHDRPRTALHARADRVLEGNATGAGDAAVAELVLALAEHRSLDSALPRAVATSASALARPVAGEIDLALRADILNSVTVTEIPCP